MAALPVCVVAITKDVYFEYALLKRGGSTIGWAIFHRTLKVAADMLPLALAEFGPVSSLVGVLIQHWDQVVLRLHSEDGV